MDIEKYLTFEKHYTTFNGYLSADPEIKYYENGKCKTKFSLPLKKQKDDDAVWLNCEAWGKLGERIAENYTKGDEITVIGYFIESQYNEKIYNNFIVKIIG